MADLHFWALRHIFSFLSYFEIKNIAKCVCKAWRTAAQDSSLWKNALALVTMKLSAEDGNLQSVSRLADDLTQRGIIRIQFHSVCPKEVILKFCKIAGKRMNQLSVKGCTSLEMNDFAQLLQYVPNIEILDLSNCFEVGNCLSAGLLNNSLEKCSVLHNLRYLNLGHTSLDMTDEYISFLHNIHKKSPELNSIGFCGFKVSMDMEMKLLEVLCMFQNIESVNFAHSELSVGFLSRLQDVFKLTEINFSAYSCCVESFRCLFKRIKNLQRLDISNVKEFSYFDCLCMIKRENIRLKSFKMPNCPAINAILLPSKRGRYGSLLHGLEPMVLDKNPFSALEELDLSDCCISDEDVSFFCMAMPKIQSLNLSSSMITDFSIQKITLHMASLKKLNISKCYRISSDAFLLQASEDANDDCGQNKYLGIQNLVQLEWLDMSNCRNLSDTGLSALLKLKSLRYLSLQGCKNITSKGVKTLAQALSCLAELNIGHLEINDHCIDILTKGLPYLSSLEISWIDAITSKSLDSISKNCKYLRYLSIFNCDSITEEQAKKYFRTFGKRLVQLRSSYDLLDDCLEI